MTTDSKLKVLFLCTGNSCRSQMAEAWARHLQGESIESYSAGVSPQGVNPTAVEVMQEAGVDMGGQQSKHVLDLQNINFDYVVTVCGHAHEMCPAFPGKTNVVHVGFDDPPQLAKGLPDREAQRDVYRRVRDEIRDYIQKLPEALTEH